MDWRGGHLRLGGRRLHLGVRRLRLINFALRDFHDGNVRRVLLPGHDLGFTPSGNAYNRGIGLTVLYLGVAMVFAMLVSGLAAIGLGCGLPGRCGGATPGR